MKNLLIILAILTFTSCVSQKACNRKFPPQTITITKDSIREVVTFRDTTIYITLKGETVTKTDTIYVKNGNVQFTEVRAESKLATGRAWTGQNRLNLTLTDKDTTILITLKNALKEAEYYKSQFANSKQTVEVKFIPKYVKIFAWIGFVFALSIIGYIAYKITHPKFRFTPGGISF